MDRPKVWRLIVWQLGPEHSGLAVRLKLLPARGNATTWWREYRARAQVEAAIALLRAVGLHGIAKHVEPSLAKPRRYSKPILVSREGFGGRLNARPISASWRMRQRRRG